jgi:hypothetical protein
MRHAGDVFQCGAEHRYGKAGEEFVQAADVVAVVVGGEDGAEAVAALFQVGSTGAASPGSTTATQPAARSSQM